MSLITVVFHLVVVAIDDSARDALENNGRLHKVVDGTVTPPGMPSN